MLASLKVQLPLNHIPSSTSILRRCSSATTAAVSQVSGRVQQQRRLPGEPILLSSPLPHQLTFVLFRSAVLLEFRRLMYCALRNKLRSLSTPLLFRNIRSFCSINDEAGRSLNTPETNRDSDPNFDHGFDLGNPNSYKGETEKEFLERLHFRYDEKKRNNKQPFQADEEWDEKPQSAEEIFQKMKERGLISNAVAMLDALCEDGLGNEALKLIALVRDEGMIPRVVIHTAAVEGFCKAHQFDDALRVFKKMQSAGVLPNAVTYQILIRGLCVGKRLEDAYEYTIEMMDAGHRPNVATFARLVEVYCREKGLKEAQDVVAAMKIKGYYVPEKAVREHLDWKGPFYPLLEKAILG